MEATKRAVTDCLQAGCHSFLLPFIAFYFINGDGKAPIE
ncbi:hypothetical protein QSI_0890 [Clostridioides difficile P28]|nr:hypothetical protein QSI_0890 [Clostridioides difficile P28]